jgi:hypothetical protein
MLLLPAWRAPAPAALFAAILENEKLYDYCQCTKGSNNDKELMNEDKRLSRASCMLVMITRKPPDAFSRNWTRHYIGPENNGTTEDRAHALKKQNGHSIFR